MSGLQTNRLAKIICLAGFCCVLTLVNGQAAGDHWDKVDDLVTSITSNCTTQKQKLDSIYFWIIHNISYDWDEAQKVISGSGSEPDVAKVLQTKKGTCDGFSLLAQDMMNHAGIANKVVHGFGRYGAEDIFADTLLLRHGWNIVQLDGKWRPIDFTWAAQLETWNKSTHFFYLSDPEKFVWSHFPRESKMALLKTPPTFQQFIDKPVIRWNEIEDFNLKSPDVSRIPNASIQTTKDHIFIEDIYGSEYALDFILKEADKEVSQIAEYKKTGSPAKGYIVKIPKPGNYVLSIEIECPGEDGLNEMVPVVMIGVIRK